ncbi:hypothetical protein I3843_01G069600 [Carya illinoinensis]|uniref:Myb-like domain-containing protein n=2 Tax=Carya illinoinensis TaxID=32201 RepID=A0A922FXH3_CARIL|nr:hypothetical protein I3842_01G070800 [Carya illinoinensis]KAG7994654.1 hypothetical protein I3843_01G069600 [Carya illinoinensis]
MPFPELPRSGNYLSLILPSSRSQRKKKEKKKKVYRCFSLSVQSLSLFSPFSYSSETMDRLRRKQAKTSTTCCSEEVSSIEWEFINMSEQEEDLIYRMYKLVGDRWALIAGRVPGRKAEEIERFWIMRHGEVFASRRKELKRHNS